MICHRELYLKRPDARFLTGFYLWISVGGVLGGIFTGLVAPAIFPDVWEYPILIVLALLCRPGTFSGGWRPWLAGGAVLAALVAVALLPHLMGATIPSSARGGWMIGLVLMSAYIMVNAQNPVRMVAATALVLIVTALVSSRAWCIARPRAAFSACIRSPRASTAASACCSTARPCTASSGCAKNKASRSPASRSP